MKSERKEYFEIFPDSGDKEGAMWSLKYEREGSGRFQGSDEGTKKNEEQNYFSDIEEGS